MNETKDWGFLAELLLEAAGARAAELGHPLWVQVLDPPEDEEHRREEGFTLALSDAENALMGWIAAPDCQAVGMIGTGRLRSAPEATEAPGEPGAPSEPGAPGEPGAPSEPGAPGEPGAPSEPEAPGAPNEPDEPDAPRPPADPAGNPPDAVRMVCLVTRNDEVTWRMARADGLGPLTALADLPPSEGRLLDCLRRCFGLPTSPPPASPARLQLIVWLVAALERAERSRRPLTWSEVSRLHPVARLLASELDASASEISEITGALTRMGATAYSWEDIRLQVARQEGFLDDIIEPDLARWMDDGMFARWVLSHLPCVDQLFAALRPRLTPSAARRMAHAVHTARAAKTAVVTE